jgi:hypothetical protein
MKTALELLQQLWPVALILLGLVAALIIGRDKKVKKEK